MTDMVAKKPPSEAQRKALQLARSLISSSGYFTADQFSEPDCWRGGFLAVEKTLLTRPHAFVVTAGWRRRILVCPFASKALARSTATWLNARPGLEGMVRLGRVLPLSTSLWHTLLVTEEVKRIEALSIHDGVEER